MRLHKRVLDRRVLYPGDILIREGDYGDSAYYIQSGQFGVYKLAGQEEMLITILPDNSVVGEMALIDNGLRSATVRCLQTATVIVVNRTTFEGKMERIDPFMRALLEMFSQKIRRLNDDYCDIERKLQWLLHQTGLPRPQPGPRWLAPRDQPAAVEARQAPLRQSEPTQTLPATIPPRPALGSGEDAAARAAVTQLTEEGIDRFDRLKLELAMLYHPDCTRERTRETLTRADVFREIWAVLKRLEEDSETPV